MSEDGPSNESENISEPIVDFSRARRANLERLNPRPGTAGESEEVDPFSLSDEEFVTTKLGEWGHPASLYTSGLIDRIVAAAEPIPDANERPLLPAESWQLRLAQVLENAKTAPKNWKEKVSHADYFIDARQRVTSEKGRRAIDIVEALDRADPHTSHYGLTILAAIIREELAAGSTNT